MWGNRNIRGNRPFRPSQIVNRCSLKKLMPRHNNKIQREKVIKKNVTNLFDDNNN